MANPTLTLVPGTPGMTYSTRGASYTPNAAGLITGVPISGYDLQDLEDAGCVVVTNTFKNGTAATGVTAVEFGEGYDHVTVLNLGAGCVLPAIAGGAALGVGTLLYTFPAGAQVITSSQFNVGITQTAGNINANAPTVGLGHVVASGAVSVLSGTATFQSINVGKAASNCTGTATEQTAVATASPFTYITDIGGVKSVYFNAAATWSAGGDPGALLTGTVTLVWKTIS